MSSSSKSDLHSSLSKLSISTNSTKKAKAEPVADSWEDEAGSSDSDTETEDNSRGRPNAKPRGKFIDEDDDSDTPSAPPPTPASPTGKYTPDVRYENPYASIQPSRERQQTPDKRPEKTTSVAARLIAGGLGVRAPKRTEEQREFDKAVREKEKKRREEEKSKVKDEEKLKASVWDD
jgi:hypothetical protein